MKTFPANLESLYPMLAYVHEISIALNFNKEIQDKLELAMEEALVNVIHYAYPSKDGMIELDCKIVSSPVGVIIEVRDKGIPFNPLEFTMKNLPTDGVGGYGIFYIKQIMDEIQYIREDEMNILRMSKYK